MRLLDELSDIFRDNCDRLSIAALMEILDEFMDEMCILVATEMDLSYEDVECKFQQVKRKLRQKAEKEKYKCP